MQFKFRAAITAALMSVTSVAGLSVPASAVAQNSEASPLAGQWTGRFGSADWTFEFKNEAGSWSGKYMSAKFQKWHALEKVRVSGRSVSFNVVSKPQLTFDLAVDNTNRTLSGKVTIPNGMGMPFSAARR